jgi:signal transduction histidine kinase
LQSCRIEEVLLDVLRLSAHAAERQKVALRSEIHPGLLPVLADPEGIRTCLQNLVTNGIQAMPRGGVLKVRVEPVAPEAIGIVVQDDGVGISPENREKIFEPYFSTKEAGVGLGLAITRSIVQEHDGEIEVRSLPQGGTEFRVLLPRKGPASPASPRQRSRGVGVENIA